MGSPFSALKEALQPVFHLETMRNGKYIYQEIQQLKDSLECFEHNKHDFIGLLKVLRAALPYIEKWRVDFNSIRTPVDSLAKVLNRPMINWDEFLSKSNASPKFQFSALQRKKNAIGLLPWLAAQSRTKVSAEDIESQIRALLECKDFIGFSQKLSAHLEKNPDFLSRLIMKSETNFIQITNTRLILYLTDRQLAEAIIKHIPKLVQQEVNSQDQAIALVDKLNEILSNGRSVSTLLRNTEAKFILDNSKLLQIYQKASEAKTNTVAGTNPPSSIKESGLKPVF
jgi:hypothetical protein